MPDDSGAELSETEAELARVRSEPVSTVDSDGKFLRFANELEFEEWLLERDDARIIEQWFDFVAERDFTIESGLDRLPDDHPEVVAYRTSLGERSVTYSIGNIFSDYYCQSHLSVVAGIPVPAMASSKRNRASSYIINAGISSALFSKTWFKGEKFWMAGLGNVCVSLAGFTMDDNAESYI